MDLSGRVVDGRYRVERRAALGGTAEIYEAEHATLRRRVALKVLRVDVGGAAAPAARARAFVGEADALRRLDHPLVATVLDAGQIVDAAGTRPYLALSWMPGRSLADALREKRGTHGPTPGEAFRLLHPLVDAVAHAHARGVVHGDLTPANVLLEPCAGGEQVSGLIDFGSSRLHVLDAPGVAARTRAYAAPEQLVGGPIGPQTDVHALALIFLEVLANRPPYGDADPGLAAIDARRPTAAGLGAEAGPFAVVLSRALALDPAQRHVDAGELAAALREVATSPSAPARTGLLIPASPQLVRRATSGRRAKLLWIVAALALLGVLGISGIVASRVLSPHRPLARLESRTIRERLEHAGFSVLHQREQEDLRVWNLIASDGATVAVTFRSRLVDCDEPRERSCRARIEDAVVRLANVAGPALRYAYASDGEVTMLVACPDQAESIRVRDAVTRGLDLDVVGVAVPGAAPSPPSASSGRLATMDVAGFAAQLRKAGLDVPWAGEGREGLVALATYQAAGASATAYLYDGDVAAIVASLKKEPDSFSWASAGRRLVVLRGATAAVTPAILARVVDGLGTDARGSVVR